MIDLHDLRRWYENVYHWEIKNPNFIIDPNVFHFARDKNCLLDLDLKVEGNILVCGCSGGNNIWTLDNEFKCRNIIGIDFSRPAIDFCSKTFPWAKFCFCCVSQLPFESNSFDRITAMDITEHLSYDIYTKFLSELYRVLKFNGKVAVLPGMTLLEEHINLLPLPIIAKHMKIAGFDLPIIKSEWIIGKKSYNARLERNVLKGSQ